MSDKNDYLNEVLEQQVRVDAELRRNRAPAKAQMQMRQAAPPEPMPVQMAEPVMPAALPSPVSSAFKPSTSPDTGVSHAPTLADNGRTVDFRITGFWRFKTVVVPPNVYVIHTRRGYHEPLHIGLGLSFHYNPYTDAFLLVPAAMQTISINAKCICKERQGVLVQAYVQWVIDDIKTAYRKLDFSDPDDPMRIVNVQLREQAEAAIKDKVATMSIDGVLSDKQPIIEELTHRLRLVAEGTASNNSATPTPPGSGLGLKIVTVQIKEAVVSSTKLWENLQAPFRAEREKLARVAQLEAQQVIAARELESKQAQETAELESENILELRRAEIERERYNREQAEQVRRQKMEQEMEQESIRQKNETEKARKAAELDLAMREFEAAAQRLVKQVEAVRDQAKLEAANAERELAKVRADLTITELKSQAAAENGQRELALQKIRREIENDISPASVQRELLQRLPEIAKALPKIESHRAVTIGGDTSPATTGLSSLVASVMALLDGWRQPQPQPPSASSPSPTSQAT